ncbi:MAG TPA: hypothetical protein VJ746_19270 [Nitrospira sp.]|nr:hypothetical protein [Nitrospira sp.]
MSVDPISFALNTSGHLRFACNQSFVHGLEQAGGRVVRQPSGHLVFHRADGLRFLSTDPAGHVLHECEWTQDRHGAVVLSRARVRLDWDAWVGIKPGGLVNETRLNLATKPGWQRLTADDLRAMAAQALRVPIEEVRWFYRDDDLSIDRSGTATIRHRKDALYVLEQGDFDRTRFMSCMGAMHWSGIDFLPVVELFKSLLPGTGSAVFELIRGLYDDQNRARPSALPLRYRGIPTYPSEAAFRLFSTFFTPQAPAHRDPLSLFMDQTRAHEVVWLPAPSPPLRYFDAAHGCCLTFQEHRVQKATLAHDAAGLPFFNPTGRKASPCDRSVRLIDGKFILQDRNSETILPVLAPKEAQEDPAQRTEVSPVDWRSLFVDGMPSISAREAYGSVLLYPEDDREIGELEAQPFVADYLQDLAEQDREIGTAMVGADRVLIENGDAVIATCVAFDRPRQYTVRVHRPAFAQKQAQQLWTVCAGLQRWDWLTRIRFSSFPDSGERPSESHDLAYVWMPEAIGHDSGRLAGFVDRIGKALRPRGCAFVVGTLALAAQWSAHGLVVSWQESVEALPTFRMHRNILPRARLKAGLTLYHLYKR